ncbi:sodium-dependent transporter [Salinigranum halophilum]|uniref:sodium-dependent transporter n=1 Tax=Salinigranum halophilum TaxID=2565931 RepID=UPI00115D625F|nr:sodium-dependent transporter [Salinigranum halophilum]
MTRETWATRIGFILAAVGSAVGLGNIWRFPWVTAENGGSAFLLVYLLVILAVGVPGLVGEFVIGRRAKRNPVGALRDLSGSKGWAVVGGFSVVTALVLLSFYSVVGGWILRYFVESLLAVAGGPLPYATEPGAYFGAASTGVDAVAYHLVFLGLTAAIVLGGVRKGIELSTTVMMPAIFVLLVALAGWAATQPDATAGYAFYLSFDLATVEENFFSILGPAAGQALFTLSLGAGTMITYASYLGEDRSLPFDAGSIAVLNTLVGVLAGLVVFPLLFSLGVEPGSPGPGALFVSIAGAFARLPAGTLIAAVFFGVVALAALSSSISMLEIPVSFLVDEFGLDRRRAVAASLAVFALTGAANALDATVFQLFAVTLVDRFLTAGLAAFLLFVGWVLGRDAIEEFRAGAGDVASRLATPWLYAVGVVLPVFLVFTLLTGLGLEARVGFWPTVALAVGVGAVAFAGLRSSKSVV